ncbi:ATP-dependent DNA/RNA helicase DHX36-like isoform X2 [Polyodon spathula]|nr:ATP-dependent DNA/RNA helicase DHX36-like isoform X2 [Polyodon spathula]
MMRTPLKELCLQIKILKLGRIASFLRAALDLQSNETVNLAVTHLMDLDKEKLEDTKRLAKTSKSDHLTVVNAFWGWEEAKQHGYKAECDYCWEHFPSSNTLQMLHNMKAQFAEHLLAAGFIEQKPQRSQFQYQLRLKVCAKPDSKVSVHPKSVNAEAAEFHYSWLIYHLKMKRSSVSWKYYSC